MKTPLIFLFVLISLSLQAQDVIKVTGIGELKGTILGLRPKFIVFRDSAMSNIAYQYIEYFRLENESVFAEDINKYPEARNRYSRKDASGNYQEPNISFLPSQAEKKFSRLNIRTPTTTDYKKISIADIRTTSSSEYIDKAGNNLLISGVLTLASALTISSAVLLVDDRSSTGYSLLVASSGLMSIGSTICLISAGVNFQKAAIYSKLQLSLRVSPTSGTLALKF
jgi:hypothetical protein